MIIYAEFLPIEHMNLVNNNDIVDLGKCFNHNNYCYTSFIDVQTT